MAAAGVLSLALIAVLGLLPLIIGVWLIVLARKKGLGYPACGQCQYDLSGTLGTSTRCPECGSDVKQVGVLAPKPGRNRVAMTLGILLLCVPITCVGVGLISEFMAQMRLAEAQQAATAQSMQSAQQVRQMNIQILSDAIAAGLTTVSPVFTVQQIDAMGADEAKTALTEVANARRTTLQGLEDARMKAQFALLLERIRTLNGASP